LIIEKHLCAVEIEMRSLRGVHDLYHRATFSVQLGVAKDVDLAFLVAAITISPFDQLLSKFFYANLGDRVALSPHCHRSIRVEIDSQQVLQPGLMCHELSLVSALNPDH